MSNTDVEPEPPVLPIEEPPIPNVGPPGQTVPLPGSQLDPIELLLMQEVINRQQAQIDQLHATVAYNNEALVRIAPIMRTMPCPNGNCSNLPEDGWTGKPIDAPGAVLMSINECVASGSCTCEARDAIATMPPAPAPLPDPPPPEPGEPGSSI